MLQNVPEAAEKSSGGRERERERRREREERSVHTKFL